MDALARIRKDLFWSVLVFAGIAFLAVMAFGGPSNPPYGALILTVLVFGASLLFAAYRHAARRDDILSGGQVWALSFKTAWYGCLPFVGPAFLKIAQRDDPWDLKDPSVLFLLAALVTLYFAAVFFLRLSFPLCTGLFRKII